SRGQQLSCPRSGVDHVHLPTTAQSDPEVSNCLVRDPRMSCSLTRYNAQRSRGQQLSRPRSVVDHVPIPATTHSNPDVSNCLVQDPGLIMFIYLLQRTAIQRSVIFSSKIRG